jgi:hypothetical protein
MARTFHTFYRPIAIPQAQIRIQNNINCPWSNQVQKEVSYHPDFIPGYSYVGMYFSVHFMPPRMAFLSDTDLNLNRINLKGLHSRPKLQ